MVRRVHREGIVLLGGGRALLMQIAHPAVAAGVVEHSSYRTAKLRRLLRTLRLTLALGFGSPGQVEQAARSINSIHSHVSGQGYDARDPELLLWVQATLIDTGLVMHERLLGPLSPDEAEAYYQDMLSIGELLGVERSLAPADLAAFRGYMEEMVGKLEVSPVAKEIARDLFDVPLYLKPAWYLLRQFTGGTLPPRLREQYGLSWGPGREAALSAAFGLSRRVTPRLPLRLRATPGFLMPKRPVPSP
jgi:uncharacterized protein (DUF2236 family)